MSPKLELSEVCFFTAEHPKHKVRNLINSSGKWTSPGTGPEKVTVLEAEFSLKSPAVITRIDIGNFWSASVRVCVGLSSWPLSQREELLPTHHFMNRLDAVSGERKENLEFFNRDRLCERIRDQAWERIRVTCSQPFRIQNDVFGLSMFVLHGTQPLQLEDTNTAAAPSKEVVSAWSLDLDHFRKRKLEVFQKPNASLSPGPANRVLSNLTSDLKEIGENIRADPDSRSFRLLATSQKNNQLPLDKQRGEPAFRQVAQAFLEGCKFEQLNLPALELVTFNNVRQMWQEKSREPLSEGNRRLLKLLARDHLQGLLTSKKKRQRTGSNESDSGSKRRRIVSDEVRRMRQETDLELPLPHHRPIDTRSTDQAIFTQRNSVATLDVQLAEKKENLPNYKWREQNNKGNNGAVIDLVGDAPAVQRITISGTSSPARTGSGPGSRPYHTSASTSVDSRGFESPGSGSGEQRASRVRYDRTKLLSIERSRLAGSGILVQEYRYKKDKQLPLRGGDHLVAKKGVPVFFYKVGPDIHMVYEERLYRPDVQPEHRCRLFKDTHPQLVEDDSYPPNLTILLPLAHGDELWTGAPHAAESCNSSAERLPPAPLVAKAEKSGQPGEGASFGECPLCGEFFPMTTLQDHAEFCSGNATVTDSPVDDSRLSPPLSCPLCGLHFPLEQLEAHAASCRGSNSSSPRASSPALSDNWDEDDSIVVENSDAGDRFGICPMCEKQLPLADLPEHAAGCQGMELNGGNGLHVNIMDRQSRCRECNQLIPDYVMEEHYEDCPARGNRRRVLTPIEKKRYKFKK